jgi:hypothetical protein
MSFLLTVKITVSKMIFKTRSLQTLALELKMLIRVQILILPYCVILEKPGHAVESQSPHLKNRDNAFYSAWGFEIFCYLFFPPRGAGN